MFFKDRSFNVKVVKDGTVVDGEPRDPMQGVYVAQAYAEVTKDAVRDIAGVIVTVVLVKTACDLMKIGAKALAN
jgi:hypothetical protein